MFRNFSSTKKSIVLFSKKKKKKEEIDHIGIGDGPKTRVETRRGLVNKTKINKENMSWGNGGDDSSVVSLYSEDGRGQLSGVCDRVMLGLNFLYKVRLGTIQSTKRSAVLRYNHPKKRRRREWIISRDCSKFTFKGGLILPSAMSEAAILTLSSGWETRSPSDLSFHMTWHL